MPYKVRRFLSSFIVYRKRGEKAINKRSEMQNRQQHQKEEPVSWSKRRRTGAEGQKRRRGRTDTGFFRQNNVYSEFLSEDTVKKGRKKRDLGEVVFLAVRARKEMRESDGSDRQRRSRYVARGATRYVLRTRYALRARYVARGAKRYVQRRDMPLRRDEIRDRHFPFPRSRSAGASRIARKGNISKLTRRLTRQLYRRGAPRSVYRAAQRRHNFSRPKRV